MYPALRAIHGIAAGVLAPRVPLHEPYVTHHRVWPWDGDMYFELNHGRALTLFEVARWRWAAQTGFVTLFRKHRISFAVAGVSVRYRRRLPVFARYRVETRIVGWDEKFFYVVQSSWQGAECAHQILVRAALKSPRGTLPPAEVMVLAGEEPESPPMPDWVRAWIDAEATRPWPPERAGS